MRIADGQRLVAEEVRRKKAQRRGERPLEVVLVVEIPATDVIVLAQRVVETGEILRVVDVVIGGGSECSHTFRHSTEVPSASSLGQILRVHRLRERVNGDGVRACVCGRNIVGDGAAAGVTALPLAVAVWPKPQPVAGL